MVAHALNLTAETSPTLELQADVAELGVSKTEARPAPLAQYWQEQRSRNRSIPWIISHRLPQQQRQGRGNAHHPLHPTTPTGCSLWRVVTTSANSRLNGFGTSQRPRVPTLASARATVWRS
eukprot:2602081-Rhodomonas_salina.3